MFVEELTKIKESENKADLLQKKAKSDSKQSLEDARIKASQIIETAENKAKEIYDSLISEGQAKSEEQYQAYLETTREGCRSMIESARNNQSSAVDLITERIVRSSVN